jgi:hypothetical protein
MIIIKLSIKVKHQIYKDYLDWSHLQLLQTILDLIHQLRSHCNIIRLQLLHILIPLEAASEGLYDPKMEELAD